MPTFTRQDSYDPLKGYSRIRWGDKSKVLDVELMEMQRIMLGRLTDVTKELYPDGFVAKTAMTYTTGTLTVPADTIFGDGIRIKYDDNMTIAAPNSSTVYLAVWEKEIVYTDAIKKQGNQSGAANLANNGIYDATIGVETSRRYQLQVQLVLSNADATKKYLPVATISSGGVMTDTRVLSVLKFNGNDVLHTANHNTTGDPHTQYLLKAGGNMTGTLTLDGELKMDSATDGASQWSRAVFFNATDASSVKTTNNYLQVNPTNDLLYYKAGVSGTVHTTSNHNTTGDPHTQYLLKAGGTMTGALTLSADPTVALHAATKQYVDTFLPKAGGTLTGALTLPGNPASALQAAPKQYVDTFLPLAGGNITGSLTVSSSAVLTAAGHNSTGDPHTQYVLESTMGVANGVATLDAGSKVPSAQIPALNYLPLTGGTVTGATTFDVGGAALSLKPGAASDHVYMSLFARSASPTTRSGYMGYGSAASTTLILNNEIANGIINFITNGTGVVQVNGSPIHTDFNHGSTGDPHTQYVLESTLGAVNGVATLGADSKVPTAQLPALNFLPLAGGTLTGAVTANAQITSTSATAFVSKYTGRKSWIMHHPSAGDTLIFAPSTTINAEDWDWTKQIVFNTDGTMTAGGATVHTTANHGSTGDPHTQYVLDSLLGVANGVATLGADSKVPTAQLPALNYVPLAGGSMTGKVTITQSANVAGIELAGATAGWASGMLFNNTTATTGRKYGIYAGSAGDLQITDETAAASRFRIDNAGVLYAGANVIHHAGNHASTGDPHTQYLLKAGGTLTGALTLAADPASALQAATKQYVDTFLPKVGGTLTGKLTTKSTTGAMSVVTGSLGAIEVMGGVATGDAAFMAFHRPGFYASYFGLDTDNQWKVGGWSAGAVANVIHHAGNHGSTGDPHTQYVLESTLGAVNGVATLGADSKVPTAQLPALNYVPLAGGSMTGLLSFGAGQSLAPDATSATVPTQGIRFSADTDLHYMFMREDTTGEKTGVILQLGDNSDDYFQIENSNAGVIGVVLKASAAGGIIPYTKMDFSQQANARLIVPVGTDKYAT